MTDDTCSIDQYTKARRAFHAARRDPTRPPTRQPSRIGSPAPTRPGYLSLAHLAARLGTSYNALASHRFRGTLPIPSVMIGGYVYVKVADVDAYLADQEAA